MNRRRFLRDTTTAAAFSPAVVSAQTGTLPNDRVGVGVTMHSEKQSAASRETYGDLVGYGQHFTSDAAAERAGRHRRSICRTCGTFSTA